MSTRSVDEIVTELLGLMPADQREACRAEVAKNVKLMRDYAHKARKSSAREVKHQLGDYLKALRAARAKANLVRCPPWHDQDYRDKEFLTQLDAEIERIKTYYEGIPVRPGGKRPDWIAEAALQCGTKIFAPDAYRRPGPQARPPLTIEGKWHKSVQLFYEAAGGKNKDIWNYLRRAKAAKGLPRNRPLPVLLSND